MKEFIALVHTKSYASSESILADYAGIFGFGVFSILLADYAKIAVLRFNKCVLLCCYAYYSR